MAVATGRKSKDGRKNYQRKIDPDLGDYMKQRGRPPKASDEVTSEMLATGEATMAQIAQLFNTDAKTLPKRMRGVLPKGQRRGYKVYSIAEAATRIVTPGYEIEDFIRQMSPQELPSHLLKEFWAGQKSRIEYEKLVGNLWDTGRVAAGYGEVLNTVRMTVLLFADDVDREQKLTDKQRSIIRRMTDALIVTLGENIAEKLKDFDATPTETDDDFIPDFDGEDDSAEEPEEVSEAEDDEEEDIDI